LIRRLIKERAKKEKWRLCAGSGSGSGSGSGYFPKIQKPKTKQANMKRLRHRQAAHVIPDFVTAKG